MNVKFTLTGLTPLLMHQDSIDAATKVSEWQNDPKNKNLSRPGDDRTPAWTWMGYLYEDGKQVVMPAENIMVCLRQAGTQIKMGRGQKTFKELTQSGMVIPSEFCQFAGGVGSIALSDVHSLQESTFSEQSAAVGKLGFRLWAKRAAIGKAKHIRVRPRFDAWSVAGDLRVVAPELTKDVLKQLFDTAGKIGLGDWRPGCKTPGSFGMFKAELKF